MQRTAHKTIRNGALVAFFFLIVFVAIVISIAVKIFLLINHSTFDGHHQFILELQHANQDQLVILNPTTNTVSILRVHNMKNEWDIHAVEVPIDAVYQLPDDKQSASLQSIFFGMIFRCHNPVCQGIDTVDAIKMYFFTKHIRPSDIQTADVSLPVSQQDFRATIQSIANDDTLYHEALSVSIINDSGEVGLGNKASQLLTDIGANVVSVTSGEIQQNTTMQSIYGKESYSVQRLEKIFHLQSQKMQKAGISDIIITIGQKHPQL